MNKDPNIPPLYYPLWFFLKGLSLLPLPVLYVLADFLYFVVYYLIGYRKKVVLQNLRSAFPEKSEREIQRIAKNFYRQFADVVVEILRLHSMRPEEMRRRITFTNQQLLDDLVKQGTPVITMGSHAANWEWILPAGAVQFSFPTNGIYKSLNNPFFEAYMLHTRSQLGTRLIEMKETSRDFVRNRKVPRVVAMLSDQTPMKNEIQYWTTFLHQDTPFYVGAEKLSNMFGYPVLYLDVQRTSRGHYTLTFETITDGTLAKPAAEDQYPITELFAKKLESTIRRSPADYLWTHKRWKHKRPEGESLGV
ncbi:lysophospholipid acyltransferase family protein [Pontibacter pamirensis]|uniref:lysophospholipid acyltransferase family protein n=1 Tax=Pontibacter pamirensis TaxID=2562824 RepID=UPI001389CDF5|nr:lysophospholipid acyltransferase family protein [Pontibacter pamirensis]